MFRVLYPDFNNADMHQCLKGPPPKKANFKLKSSQIQNILMIPL